MNGLGVEPDDAMAITYYRDAARAGHPQAQGKLRTIYVDAGLELPEFVNQRTPNPPSDPKRSKTNSSTGSGVDDRTDSPGVKSKPLSSAIMIPQGVGAIAAFSNGAYDGRGTGTRHADFGALKRSDRSSARDAGGGTEADKKAPAAGGVQVARRASQRLMLFPCPAVRGAAA
jgi:TPR repeat protein